MTTGVGLAAATSALTAWATLINAPGGLQRLEVFNDTRPANVNTAPASAAMFSAAVSAGAASVVVDELVIAGPGPSTLVLADGPPTWGRLYGGAGGALFDMDARLFGDPDAGEEIVVSATALTVGAIVRVTVGNIRLPE